MAIDSLQFIRTVSNGSIDYIEIAGFEALSSDGQLKGQVSNLGGLVHSFSLTVLCSTAIQPIAAIRVSLQPGETQQIIKNLYSIAEDKHTPHICNLTLYNNLGQYCDR